MRDGNHSRTLARQASCDIASPPGTSPAASAGATYLATVVRSTPTLRATWVLLRPEYQCSRISITSIMLNVLLAMSSPRPSGRGRACGFEGPGAENADRGGAELLDRITPTRAEFRDRQQYKHRKSLRCRSMCRAKYDC